jgi:hypothetical protein
MYLGVKKTSSGGMWILNVPQRLMCWRLGPQCINVQRWGFGKWLNYEGSNLISGLNHWQVLDLMSYRVVMETQKVGTSWGECVIVNYIFFPAPSSPFVLSASWQPWGEKLYSDTCHTMIFCLPKYQENGAKWPD